MLGASTADGGRSFQSRNTRCENEFFLMSSLLGVLCRVCWVSYVESAECLMSNMLGVLCRVCWVSYVESAGCLMSSLLGITHSFFLWSEKGLFVFFSVIYSLIQVPFDTKYVKRKCLSLSGTCKTNGDKKYVT